MVQPGSGADRPEPPEAHAQDWAEIQEPLLRPLYRGALNSLLLAPEARVLDVGCGAGLFCAMATQSGLKASGRESSAALLALARRREPGAEWSLGELDQLPWPSASHDAVTGFNTMQFQARPVEALREAHRILKPGGRLLMTSWGRPQDCEATAYLNALETIHPPAAGSLGFFGLSADGAMSALTSLAGFQNLAELHISTVWDYVDEDTALLGLLSTAQALRAIAQAGESAVVHAVRQAISPFRQADGNIRLRNVFRYVLARK